MKQLIRRDQTPSPRRPLASRVHWIHTEDCDVAIAELTKGALSLLVLFVSCGNFKPAVNGVYLCVVALVPLVPVLVFYLLSVSSPRVLSTAGVLVPRTPDPLCGRPVPCCAPLPCSSLSFPPSFLSRCTGLLLPRPACCRQRCNTYVLCCVEVCSVSVLVPQDCSSAPDPPVPSPLKHRHIHNSALTTRLCLCLCLSLCLSHCLPRRSPSLPPLHATPAEGNSNNNRQKNGPEMRKWENVKIERARPARRTTPAIRNTCKQATGRRSAPAPVHRTRRAGTRPFRNNRKEKKRPEPSRVCVRVCLYIYIYIYKRLISSLLLPGIGTRLLTRLCYLVYSVLG